MPDEIMTEVSAMVPDNRADEVVAAFEELLRAPMPDGLVRTELLRGRDGRWSINTLWRDQDALDGMRIGTTTAAAPALFRKFGAEPSLRVYKVQARYSS